MSAPLPFFSPATPAVLTPDEGPAFEVRRPRELVTPLIFASPHAGRVYPASLMDAARLDAHAIRRSEDAFVDALIEPAFGLGIAGVVCRTARVFVDVNREPWELDPAMFEDALPGYARSQTPRVAAGLGSIARVVGEGQEVYGRKLAFAEAKARIEMVHRPYHTALETLVTEAKARFGLAVLVDWHSMPSVAALGEVRRGRGRPQMVLGDRHGAACAKALTQQVRRALEALGYAVTLNVPYAGGYTTQTWGRPQDALHALQVEIDRGLYLDETTLERGPGYDRLARDLGRLCAVMAQTDWAKLLRR